MFEEVEGPKPEEEELVLPSLPRSSALRARSAPGVKGLGLELGLRRKKEETSEFLSSSFSFSQKKTFKKNFFLFSSPSGSAASVSTPTNRTPLSSSSSR